MSLQVLTAALALVAAPPSVGELVRRGDAGRAYLLLTEQLDDERAARDTADTLFWADLLRYLRCSELQPLPSGGEDSYGYRHARTLLTFELLRLERLRREERPSGPEAWIAQKKLRWTMPPVPSDRSKLIEWPPEDEKWSDEALVVPPPPVRCGKTPARPRPQPDRRVLSDEAEAMRTLRLTLPELTSVRAALLLDEAVVRARLADWPEVWVLVRLLDAEAARPGGATLSPAEQAQAAILSGLAAERDGRDEEALARWDRAAELPLSPDQKRFVDVRRQRLLIAFGRPREARALLDGYANLEGELGRYLRYRNALARFQSGDEGGTLAIARELLGRKTATAVAFDPIDRAAEELVYLQLVRHPLTDAQVEVVESIGPVREVYHRMESLGAVALERGRPQMAVQVYRWLLEKHPDGYARPLYLGRLAAAGAAADDPKAFADGYGPLVAEAMAPPPPVKKGQKPARRNIEWDRQLLLATRDSVVPLIAAKRWVSLKLVTTELQKYLRSQKNPYDELTRLYRMASEQLPVGSRAYAEKVGAERGTVWLGEVTVFRPRSLVEDPDLALPRLDGPVTLLCLPDGRGGCPRWLGPDPPPPAKATKRAPAPERRPAHAP